MSMLDQVNIDPKGFGHLNAEYGRARTAIEAEVLGRKNIRAAKMAVIKMLGGTLHEPVATHLRKFVQFPDNTKAVF